MKRPALTKLASMENHSGRSDEELFKEHYSRYYKEKPNKRPYTVDQLKEVSIDVFCCFEVIK